MVEFVSYDGSYPNLCTGKTILKINGETVILPPYSLTSGGYFLVEFVRVCGQLICRKNLSSTEEKLKTALMTTCRMAVAADAFKKRR